MFAETGDNMIKRKRVLAWTLKEKTGNHNQKMLSQMKKHLHAHTYAHLTLQKQTYTH